MSIESDQKIFQATAQEQQEDAFMVPRASISPRREVRFDPENPKLPPRLVDVEDEKTGDNTDVEKGGAKFDIGKVRVDLVPGEFMFGTAAALTYGAAKYDDWNWAKGLRKGRVMAALGRHWIAYMMGEDLDLESNLPHTWHMAACLAMLIGCEMRGTAVEDRQNAVQAYQTVQEQFAGMKDPR